MPPVSPSDGAELAKPADAADIALAGKVSPVFMSRQCGFQPGGSLHSDGIIICAWVVGGVKKTAMVNVARRSINL